MIVAKDGSGDFTTVQEAVDAIPENASGWTEIHIKNGEYREKLQILKPRVRLVGESAEGTVLCFDDYAKKTFPDGREYGTFNSQS
ncbi:MAG: pemA1, partial [Paenibacillaceae bacterium]|nr:pemA1 [Paenibacillaceae bacterium]